ncbi:ParB/RepB/Spo0J family partition protein [Salinisphaera sp. P385]|uniref:Probable chromosome-partitioning protein ParB n=1 Tax=Spectribacter acetivorans TaxID=3075603 RepID=A0ABU3BAW6_9GAMM|nr:ParB/RepB/Spo0J family partition protein [Salinisphaera sp. P385]MDT0618403.1 ParB/RepB/Spo0J family partition protein [Salinisphaera sp. P385]
MAQPPESQAVRRLAVDMIHPGTFQARRRFSETALAELAHSIGESGVVQPVVVRTRGDDGYELLAGERRWRAAQLAGLHDLPAVVRDDLTDAEAAILGLIENLQRESLGPMETARGLESLCREHGLTHDGAADRIGKSRAYVTNYLRLLKLEASVQTAIDDGELTLGHAKILAGIPPAEQPVFARHAVRRRLSVRALETAWRRSQARDDQQVAGDAGASREMAELERALSEHLGNAVHIRYDPDRRKGEVRVTFHDLDEFDGLLQRWGFDKD